MPRNWTSGINDERERLRFERREQRRQQRETAPTPRQERRANETQEERELRRFWRVQDEVAGIWPVEAGETRYDEGAREWLQRETSFIQPSPPHSSILSDQLNELQQRIGDLDFRISQTPNDDERDQLQLERRQALARLRALQASQALQGALRTEPEVDEETRLFLAQVNSVRRDGCSIVVTKTVERADWLMDRLDWITMIILDHSTGIRFMAHEIFNLDRVFLDPLCIRYLTEEQWRIVWSKLETPEMGFEEEPQNVDDVQRAIGDHILGADGIERVWSGTHWLRRQMQPADLDAPHIDYITVNGLPFTPRIGQFIEGAWGRLIFDGRGWLPDPSYRPPR